MEDNKTDFSHLLDEEAFAQAYSEALDFKSTLEEQNLSAELQNLEERYEVKYLLGEGAVKKVYLAFDKLMDRNVALAKIKNNDQALVDDFLREARLSSTLEHPFISPVYDMGFSEDGLPFFVMKLYDGRNLREELLQREKQSIDRGENITWILDVFLKVCEAVSFAHSKNVLHLDIKPSNIRMNDHGEVLLCDWGIARMISGGIERQDRSEIKNSAVISRATLLGEIRGTPGFMAPEQEDPELKCDERTDVYGLGALLEDMISGEPPGRGQSLREVNCPREIAAICKKATAKIPAERYSTVQFLIDDINKYKSGMVTSAEKASSLSILKKWALRHKTAVSIVLFNALLISAFLYVYIRDIQDSKNNLETVVDMLQVQREEQRANQINQAQKYYDQSYELYCNAVSQFDFDARDILQSLEMVVRSLELDPSHSDAWGLSGRLRLIQGQLEHAISDFSKGGEKYRGHYESLKSYSNNIDLERHENHLRLIRLVDTIKDKDKRLRNHIIFKGIHTYKDRRVLLDFSVQCVAVVNNMKSINWSFDKQTQTLDLRDNKRLRTVYPLKTMRFERLILKNTSLNSHEIHNLRRIPLKYLDASYTKVTNLDRLANEELIEFSLEGSKVKNLSKLSTVKVKILNIAKTKADLSTLKGCSSLEKIICSSYQLKELESIFKSNVEFQVID